MYISFILIILSILGIVIPTIIIHVTWGNSDWAIFTIGMSICILIICIAFGFVCLIASFSDHKELSILYENIQIERKKIEEMKKIHIESDEKIDLLNMQKTKIIIEKELELNKKIQEYNKLKKLAVFYRENRMFYISYGKLKTFQELPNIK